MGLLCAPLEARRGIYTGHGVCIPVCVYMEACGSVLTGMYTQEHVCVSVLTGMCICAHRCVHTCTCMCVHAHVYICAHRHVHTGTCVCIIDMFESFGTGRPCSIEAQIYSPDVSVPNWLTYCCSSKETPPQVMHSQIWRPESKIRMWQGHAPSGCSRRRSLLPLQDPRGSRHLSLWLPPSQL